MPALTTPRRTAELGVVCALVLACLAPSAHAFKPKTHIWLAEAAYNDIRRDCKVSITYNRGDYNQDRFANLGSYEVAPDVCAAIRKYPGHYWAGVAGPDANPDFITPQVLVHGHVAKAISTSWGRSHSGTDAWLSHLWQQLHDPRNADVLRGNRKAKAIAYVYGYMTHAAGDMFAHTFVNAYTGGPFTLSRGNMIRHIVLEGYIGALTPTTGSVERVTIAGLEKFLYRALVKSADNPKLMGALGNDFSKWAGPALASIPAVFLKLRKNIKYKKNAARTAFERSYYRSWMVGIDDGLKAWITTGHRISETFALGKRGRGLSDANQAFSTWRNRYMPCMLGLPSCKTLAAASLALAQAQKWAKELLPAALVAFADSVKQWTLDKICQSALNMRCREFMDYQTNPARHFDSVLARKSLPGDKGCVRRNANQHDPASRGKRQCITLARFDRLINKHRGGTFNWAAFAPAYNTVQLSKLVLLSKRGAKKLLRDLVLRANGLDPKVAAISSRTARMRVLAAAKRAYSTSAPNFMLGWLQSADAGRQWCMKAPDRDNDPHQLHDQVKPDSKRMVLSRFRNIAFRKLFKRHAGIHRRDDCVGKRLRLAVPYPSDDSRL